MKLDQKKYVERNGIQCPKCGSQHIESAEIPEVNEGTCDQLVRCNDCNLFWWDIYHLVGYEVKDDPDDVYTQDFRAYTTG